MMKELHFYIQSILILLAMGLALQIWNNRDMVFYVLSIQFFLGAYQYGMSWFLIRRLSCNSPFLTIYFTSVNIYILALLFLSLIPDTLTSLQWKYILFGVPWVFSIYFLVVMENLLWRKKPLERVISNNNLLTK